MVDLSATKPAPSEGGKLGEEGLWTPSRTGKKAFQAVHGASGHPHLERNTGAPGYLPTDTLIMYRSNGGGVGIVWCTHGFVTRVQEESLTNRWACRKHSGAHVWISTCDH